MKHSTSSADGHWVTDVFEKSHKMSTYLVAFAVTNFESRSEGNVSKTNVRVLRAIRGEKPFSLANQTDSRPASQPES